MSNAAPDEMLYYMGNPRLKAANVPMSYSYDQIQERIKCAADVLYFIENYIKINTTDDGLVPFTMWPFQKELIQTFEKNRFVIAKMPRQVGKSTTSVSYLLWVVLFQPMQNIAILANKASTAREILARLQLAYENLPLWMQQGIKAWNKGNIELENGSRIIANSTSADSIRGFTYNIIFLDEFAHVPHNIAEDFITSVFPTISSGKTTKIIMVSTPLGLNLFYNFWEDAIQGRSVYVPFSVHWSDVPGRDEEWHQTMLKLSGPEKFRQEFDCEFIGSSHTLIGAGKLRTLTWKEPVFKYESLKVYEEPTKDHLYVLTVDTARGQNLDYSAFSVIDVSQVPYKQVAVYRDKHISSMIFPNIIYDVATKYNTAFVMVETNDSGGQVADILYHDLQYEYVLCSMTKGRGGQRITLGMSNKAKLGFKTTLPLKVTGCSNLRTLVEEDKLIVQDKETITELRSFVAKGKSFEADEGHNDDTVMSLVFFSWLSTQPLFKDLTDINIQKKLFDDKQKALEQSMLPFGFHSTGDEVETFVDKDGDVWTSVDEEEAGNMVRWWKDMHYVFNDDDDSGSGSL